MPHLRITRQRYGVGMCHRGVLVHCPSRLRAAVAVLTAELPCRDEVFTKRALKRGEAAHHHGAVMSHSLNCSHLSGCDCALKLHRVSRPLHS